MRRGTTAAAAVFRPGARRVAFSIAVMVAAASVAACSTDDLLEVETPANVPVGLLDEPGNAGLMVGSAVADFECALGGMIAVEGIISDELGDAQLGAAAWPYDRRDANTQPGGPYGTNACTSNQTPGIYNPLSTARWSGDHAIKNLTEWTDTQVPGVRQALLARAALYTGFSYSLIGMSFCSAAFDLGPEVQQADIFKLAEERFTQAITAAQVAPTSTLMTTVINAAYVGRARVRLFMGNAAGAAADATLVPSGFALNAANDASDNRLMNRIFQITQQNGFYTVEAASRGLTTEKGEVDPRSATKLASTRPADARSAIWVAEKYPAQGTPTPIASYKEARLILAEARGGQEAVTIINALRATVGLQGYTGPTDAASIRNLIIDERRRALFLEGFRNYDMQRFQVPFNPAPGAPYPIKGGTYGNTRCLPLPDVERVNNPNIGP